VLNSLANAFGVIHLENMNVGKVRCGVDENKREFTFDEFLDQSSSTPKVMTGYAIDRCAGAGGA